jgi:hypothetical protein
MGKQLRFWGLVLRRTAADFKDSLSATREHLMLLAIQLAVAFLILRYVPGLGELRDQVSDVVLLALAVLVTAALRLVLGFLAAPAKVHADAADRVDKLERYLGRDAEEEACRAELEQLFYEGRDFIGAHRDYAEWKSGWVDEWASRARDAVVRHYRPQDVFDFDNNDREGKYPLGGIEYPVDAEDDLGPLITKARRTLQGLENMMVRMPSVAYYRYIDR